LFEIPYPKEEYLLAESTAEVFTLYITIELYGSSILEINKAPSLLNCTPVNEKPIFSESNLAQ
jgi:hypothetical protein